jgi:Kef-type K+ transport system membrane component KefB
MAETSDAAIVNPDAKKDPLSTKSGKSSPHNLRPADIDTAASPLGSGKQRRGSAEGLSEVERLQRDVDRLTKMNDQLTAQLQEVGRQSNDRDSLADYDVDWDDYDDGPSPLASQGITTSQGMIGHISTKSQNRLSPNMTDASIVKTATGMSRQTSLRPGVAPVTKEEMSQIRGEGRKNSYLRASTMSNGLNRVVMGGSAMSKTKPVQAAIYLAAFSGVIFTLVAKSTHLGESDSEDDHRRLGGDAPPLMTYIAYALLCAGMLAMIINFIKQPLILGYLLGGVAVGPHVLNIIHSHEDISTLSSLGLIFLLFMVGLELNVKELLKMGKVVLVTGALQFPICAGLHICIFTGLAAAGLSFGEGNMATMYSGMVCGISSTMIVVKGLSVKCDTDSAPGRLTIGILIFQDIWAIIILAVQPNLDSPDIVIILKTFGMIAVLLAVAMLYAKFVMPAVLWSSSKNVELMLVLSLAWCFFVGCVATLPFIGLSFELASLIAGVALAAFPYSAEFNGKIKYIRDFFITLFFVGLGMQIPPPTFAAVGTGVLIAAVVLVCRWIGIYSVVRLLGGRDSLAGVATINLSQVSEFALVICSLGMQFGHIEDDTLTIIIWTFAVLAVASSYFIDYNRAIWSRLAGCKSRLRRGQDASAATPDDHDDHEEHDILILGFHKVAAGLLGAMHANEPQLLRRVHVVDCDEEILALLKERGVKSSYGDISSADVLEHVHHGDAKLVVSTISDSLLQDVTNMKMLKIGKQLWPEARCIMTAETRWQSDSLYKHGAAYVLRVEKLCAERLSHLIKDHCSTCSSELDEALESYKRMDAVSSGSSLF